MDLEEALKLLRSNKVEKLQYEAVSVTYALFPHKDLFYHTERVVHWARKIGKERGLDVSLLTTAAWLHDIGYVVSPKGHAKVGAEMVKKRLEKLGVEKDLIELIEDAIENHGSKGEPRTDYGHVLRLSDALAVWDPHFIGFFLLTTPCEEWREFLPEMEKKWAVIEEYGYEEKVDREGILQSIPCKE
jgi:putative nucleotidyltransferase with HDIG domain